MLMTNIRKKMHIGLWAIAIMFTASIFLYFGMGGPNSAGKDGAQGKKESKFICEINGEKIPFEIFNYEFKEMKRYYEMQGVPDLDSYPMQMRLKADTLRRLLIQEVFIQEAEQRNVELNSAELARRIKQERDRTVGAAPEAAPGITGRLKAYGADNKKNKEFRQRLGYLGVSYKTYKQIMQRRALAEKVMQDMAKEKGGKQQKEVEEKALKTWRKIKSGESFEKLAAQFTEDEATKDANGVLGWKKRGDLEDALAAAAFSMKPGQYSRPIKTSLGFQIIKVDEFKAASGPEYEMFRSNYVRQLMAEDPKARPPAERDLQKMFESVLLRHILFKIKDGQTLATEWANEKIDKEKVKYTVLDKELHAYMALQKAAGKGEVKQAALEKVLKMYEAALKSDSENHNLYYQIGALYEQMNRLINDKLKKGGKDKKKTADPYEKSTGADNDVKSTVYLDSALESYMKAYAMSEETGDMSNSDLIMGIARISKTLSEKIKDKKKSAKYKNRAKEFYVLAIDYAYDNIYVLKQVEAALEEYKDKKNLKEVKQLIADIEQQYMEEQGGLNQFEVEDEAPAQKSPPQKVKVVPSAEQGAESSGETPPPGQKAPESQNPPAQTPANSEQQNKQPVKAPQ